MTNTTTTGQHPQYTAGVDEVGRGPLAGPVTAAAVSLPAAGLPGLMDAKKLSPTRRAALSAQIHAEALACNVGWASVAEIDGHNIRQATLRAMERAVAGLTVAAEHALIDGRDRPQLACTAEAVIGGDREVAAISAASIVAKVARDEALIALAEIYPGYGFERHKGYGSQAHMTALAELGPCPIHRRSFAPVRALSLNG